MEAVFRSYVLGFLPVTSWSFPAKNSLENVHEPSKHVYYSSGNDRIPPGNIQWFFGCVLRKFTKKYSYFMRKRWEFVEKLSEFFRKSPDIFRLEYCFHFPYAFSMFFYRNRPAILDIGWHDAADEDLNHFRSRRTLSSSSSKTPAAASNHELSNTIAMGAIDNQRLARYLEPVPLPPAAYMFPYRQRQKQRSFFEQFLSTPLQQQPYSVVDLYQMKIIAVRKWFSTRWSFDYSAIHHRNIVHSSLWN